MCHWYMLDCVLSVMVCWLFLYVPLVYARLCVVCHGLLADPLVIIGMLDCVLSVMVCLLFLYVSLVYARLCVVCHGLLALPLYAIGIC